MNNGLGMQDRYASWLIVDPLRPNEMYLLSGSVFFSPDTGNSWGPISDGLPHGHKQELVIDPVNRRLFTAVPGDSNGVYILDLQTSAGDQVVATPSEFKLQQNYPNPFNSSTMIELQVPTHEHGKLEVFDILGRRVAVIANGNIAPGMHRVPWDATNHPSGMYVCRFQSAHRTESIIMTLIR